MGLEHLRRKGGGDTRIFLQGGDSLGVPSRFALNSVICTVQLSLDA